MADGRVKRRAAGEQLRKEDIVDDEEDEGEVADPGTWQPADSEAVKTRRKVVARRRGGAAEASAAAPADIADSGGVKNPFATIAFAAPAAQNPFAGFNLVAPAAGVAAQSAELPATAATADTAPPAKAGDATVCSAPAGPVSNASSSDQKQTAPSEAAAAIPSAIEASTAPTPDRNGGPASTTTMTAPGGFASLGAAGGSSGFGGFASAAASGGGFGSFSGGFGSGSGAAGGFGALGQAGPVTGFGSAFSFGTGAFPPVTSAGAFGFGASGKAAAAQPNGSDAGGEGGEGAEGAEAGDGDDAGDGPDALQLFGNGTVKPLVNLPERAKRTGEEEDVVLFTAEGALYEYDSVAIKWRERGKGEFKVNTRGGHARLVMRQAVNLRLLLNAKVYHGMPVHLLSGNVGVSFGVVNGAALLLQSDGAATASPPAIASPVAAAGSKSGASAGADSTAPSPAASRAPESGPQQTAQASCTEGGDAEPRDADKSNAGSTQSSAAKATTWCVRIKSVDKVLSLFELLTKLKSAAEGTGAEEASLE